LLEQELQKLTANSNYINTTTQYNQLIEQINCQQLLLTKHIGEINIVKSKIINENLLENDITCPICGTYLTNDVIKEHLHSKRQYWEQILNSLLSEQIVIENSLNKFLEEKIILEKLQSKLLQENITIDNKILEYTTIKNIHKQFLTDQNILLLDLKDKINHVDSNNLANKLKELEIVLSEWQELSEAKQINANISTTILTFQTQLSLLPFLSNEIRQNLLIEIEKVKQEVLQLKNKRSILEKDLSHIKITITKYENEYNNLQNQLTLISYKYSQAQKNIENITTDISKQETNLPTNFKHHKSIVDEIEFIAFKEEIQVLSDIEHKYKELTTAQTRIHQFVGAITLLEEQLEKIILEYRRPIEEVEKEYYKVADEELNIQNQLDQAKRKLIELENQRKAYLETKTFRDKAEKEVIYFTKLANTFGKKGLQAKIIQAAQEKIKQHANTTLRRLSNGIWQVDLQENSQGTELEILARDLSQPKSPLRSFEYLSGGEKFRVAISLAIAIGQSISGGRTVDTLVIDEGFGALDEVNRALLVNELRRLSEEILHGGRIIIVSHQEDVCWEFANRYHIYKGLDGLIEVEHNWNR
jgi:exonuclease SbcC